jgi:hypothetical protein
MDTSDYSKLLEDVYRFQKTGARRDIAHILSNSLTPLAMQTSMLKQALDEQDVAKAGVRLAKLKDSIDILRDMTRELMTVDRHIGGTSDFLDIHQVLVEQTKILLTLPQFQQLDLRLDLSHNSETVRIQRLAFQVFLYTYFACVADIDPRAVITLIGAPRGDDGNLILEFSAEITTNPPTQYLKRDAVSSELGRIPLSRIAVIFTALETNMRLKVSTDTPLNCRLSIQS